MTRPAAERIANTVDRLETEPNAWLATASLDGRPHLIPLSLGWKDGQILFITPTDSPTVHNIDATGQARVSLDSADDVAIFAGRARTIGLASADPDLVASIVERIGWDPRTSDETWSLVMIEPRLVHVWNGEPEIEGRTVMRRGSWIE